MPYASSAIEDLYGLTHEAVAENCSPIFARIHPDDVASVRESVAKSAREMNPWHACFRYRHPRKGVRWIEGHSIPVGEADGSVLWHGYIQDITDRKQAEDSLRASEAQYRLAVETLDAGLWFHDLTTGAVHFSPEWKRQLGYAENELPERWEEWENRLHPDERDQVLAMTGDYLNGHLPHYEIEFRLSHRDGTYRWILARGAVLRDTEGHPYRVLGMNLDITEHKRSQEIRERRKKMEEMFRLYVATQTAAAIAHELNQPLTAITSYVEVALFLLEDGKPDMKQLTDILEKSANQAERAGRVTRQLLALLRKGETFPEPMSLQAAVQEAVDIIKSDDNLGPFKVALVQADDIPLVLANRLQIEKVLVNLIDNGLEAMQEAGMDSGLITVTSHIATGATPMAQVSVRDSGKGVTAENLKSLFQPFYTTKPLGLGMGLAISRALIEANGGRLWAERDANPGVIFHFTLPFALE